MKRLNRFVMLAALVACQGAAFAQAGWGDDCIDPEVEEPRVDRDVLTIGNSFIIASVGQGGTVQYGGDGGPCYDPSRTLDYAGRLGFQVGSVGSVQSDFDNFMTLTMGMPVDPAGDFCYAQVLSGTGTDVLTPTLFGEGGVRGFTGLSGRYNETTWTGGGVQVVLRTEVVGDAAILRWRMRNVSGAAQRVGLRFGAYVAMRSGAGGDDQFGHNQAGTLLRGPASVPRPTQIPGADGNINQNGSVMFIETPTTRPVRTEKNWLRSNPRFPDFVNFQWSQWLPYGIRIDNVPDTERLPGATSADQMLIGTHGFLGRLGGLMFGNNMRGRVSTDFTAGDPALDQTISDVREDSDTSIPEASFIQVFRAEPVEAGGTREIIQYIRSPWSVADYAAPYAFVLDAPRLIESSPGSLNDLSPNPMTISAAVDNQYAFVDASVPLTNVQFTINLPEEGGLRLAPGETPTKTLASVAPNSVGRVQWSVEASGEQLGRLPYTVTVRPFNSAQKTLQGSVLVSATPRLRLPEGAVLMTVPWNFADTSLDAIFGPQTDPDALKFGRDYIAYKWDPITGQYLPQISARRGEALWIVALNDFGFQGLNGATLPTDLGSGGLTTSLQTGWNMIGNPYPFAVPLSQLLGIGLSDPSRVLTWGEMVDNGWVSPSLAFWNRSAEDPLSGFYEFTSGPTDVLLPNRGYWVFVTTPQPIRLTWPSVTNPGLSNTTRRPGATTSASLPWRQSDRQWRLQLSARTESGVDSQNFVGVTTSASEATKLRRYEPPMAPNGKVSLAIEETVAGKPSRLAAAFADSKAKRTWRVIARTEEEGNVTLTWPNITTVPRNVRFTLKDLATNTTRDLRFNSSYSFAATEASVRQFEITMEPAGAQRALIGGVTVQRSGRDTNGPVTINYTLSTEAMTTIRVLSSGGREVYRFHRGRSDGAGDNQVTWTLRDSANRAVAPGTYQVEIVAETSNGERVRKIVPVNVVR